MRHYSSSPREIKNKSALGEMSHKRDGSVLLTDRSSEAIRASMKPLTRKQRIDQTD